jgi:hypothetical protein
MSDTPTGALARYCPCGHTANYHRGTPELAQQFGCTGKEGNKPGSFGAYHCRCSATLADVIEHGLTEKPTGPNPGVREAGFVSGEREALADVLAKHRPVEDGIHSDYFGPPMRWLTCTCKKWKSEKAKNYWSPSELPAQHRAHVADALLAAGWRGPEIVAQLRDMEIERNILRETLRGVLANHPDARSGPGMPPA